MVSEPKHIKVLMQGKIDLFDSGGGDRVQIENTAEELRKLGVQVDIIPGFGVDYSKYDLVHLFQLDWTPETYLYAKQAKKARVPVVLSPIHHNVTEVNRFDTYYAFDFRRLAKILFKDQFKRDVLKNIYKSIFDRRKVYPTLYSLIKGFKTMQREVLNMVDIVLVQTELEARDLMYTFDIKFRWAKVVNGVGAHFFDKNQISHLKNKLPFENYILCIGRIEARKNQLSVISAVEKLRKHIDEDIKLVFVGAKSKLKHFEYVKKFEHALSREDWIYYISEVPYKDVPAYLKFAKVGVSASWFETTGLTSLEALFCGTNAVATGSRAKEYLGDLVSYCDPGDIDSITLAIQEAYYAERPKNLPADVLKYTWKNAAKETLDVYNGLLSL